LRPRSDPGADRSAVGPSTGGLLKPRDPVATAPPPPTRDLLVPRDGSAPVPARSAPAVRLSKTLDGPPPVPASPATIDPTAIQTTLRQLKRDVPTLLELLFAEQSAAELLRQVPDERRFEDRLRQVETHLHEADRDGGDRYSLKDVKAARARFEALRGAPAKTTREELAAAVEALRSRQRGQLVSEIGRHVAVGTRTLYGSDVLKIERAGHLLGFSPEETRHVAASEQYVLLTTEAREWVPFEMLPGAPSTLAEVAQGLLRHEAEAVRALRQRAVSRWLQANGDAELADRVIEVEPLAHQPGNEALAQHLAAWHLGARQLYLEDRAVASPEELGRRWGRGEIEDRSVVQCARSQVLGAWFATLDERVLEARAHAVAARPNDPGVRDQLRWSLGVAWSLGNEAFTDVRTLADRTRTSPTVAQAAQRAAADGTLGAWLESLPAGRGDPTWQVALTDPHLRSHGAACGFWVGVYRNASERALVLSRDGAAETFTSWLPLLQTGLGARYWDALKPLRNSGELVAFLLHDREHPVQIHAIPPLVAGQSLDVSLNILLWSLGASGMVVEWGSHDRPVQAIEDMARLYEEDPERFAEELAKGYPFVWLETRLGDAGVWSVALRVVREQMLGRAPLGHEGAALAMIVRRGGPLPIDPRRPTQGMVSRIVPVNHPDGRDWGVLYPHLASGLVLFWLLGQNLPTLRPTIEHMLRAWAGGQPPPPAEQLIQLVSPYGRLELFGAAGASIPPPPPVFVPAAASRAPTPPPPRSPSPVASASRVPLVAGLVVLTGLGVAGVRSVSSRESPPVVAPPAPPPTTTQPENRPVPATPGVSAGRQTSVTERVRCQITGAPTRLGRFASNAAGATISRHGEQLGVGWVVSARRNDRGADDSAAALVSIDGQLVRMLDDEQPDDTEYPGFSPRAVGRVTVGWDGDAPAVLVDEMVASQTDETIRCGGLTARWPLRRDGAAPVNEGAPAGDDNAGPGLVLGDTPTWTADLLQPYWCRTLNPASPFVIGQRLFLEEGGVPKRRTNLFAAALDGRTLTAVTDFSLSRTLIRGIPASPTPRRLLKDRVASDWRGVTVEGRGHLVVWRDGGKIRGAWLDPSFARVGAVWEVETNDRSSAPEVRMEGVQGWLTFATRLQTVEGSPYRLAMIPLSFGAPAGGLRWLATTLDDPRIDHIAPALAPLPDSRWMVAFTARPRREVATLPHDEQSDAVYLQTFDAAMQPLMSAWRAVPLMRDAELVSFGSRFVLVSFGASSGGRTGLFAVAGGCDPL